MPSTYTTRLRLELQATGENRTTWGTNANSVFTRIEEAIAGMSTVAMGDANVTLTTANGTSDQARNMTIKLTGANTAIRTVTIPSVTKFYLVGNFTTGGFSVTVKTAAGSSVSVDNGVIAIIWCDGTDCTRSFNISATYFNGQPDTFYRNASNINAGTLADARLPSSMANKEFTGTTNLTNTTNIDGITSTSSSALFRNVTNANLVLFGGTSGDGANIELYGSTHPTVPNRAIFDADVQSFRMANGTGTPTVTIGGNTVWHAGNDGTGSGLDADLLDGQHGSFYQSASNINAGTLAVARGGTGATTASAARTNLGLAIGSDVQAFDSELNAIAALAVTNGNFIVGNGTTWVAESGSTARSSLGLGSLATLSTINDTNWSGTDLAVANGGTGSSTASGARTNLGLAIGSDVQAFDADLTTLAAWPNAPSGRIRYMAKDDLGVLTDHLIGDFSATLISNTNATEWRNDLSLGTGNDVVFANVEAGDMFTLAFPLGSPDFSSSTTAGYYLASSGLISSSRSGANAIQLQRTTSDGSVVSFRRDTSQVGTITLTATATAYNTSSDIRLKQDLQPINPALLDAIKVYDFEWKKDGTRAYGVMAQELEPILPQAVNKGETPEDMWDVDYSKLVPLLIATVQELKERVKILEAKE